MEVGVGFKRADTGGEGSRSAPSTSIRVSRRATLGSNSHCSAENETSCSSVVSMYGQSYWTISSVTLIIVGRGLPKGDHDR